MQFKIIYILFFLICISCNSSNNLNKNILIEKPTNLIVNESDKTPYTGVVIITGDENITFKGEALNGRKQGNCSWVKENGDTVLLQIYEKGDRVYSNQFINGKRSKETVKYQPEVTSFDSLLIDSVFQMIKNSDFKSLKNMVEQYPSFVDLVEKKFSELESKFGKLQEIKLEKIDKSSYNFRPEKYLELETIISFSSEKVRIGIRLLEDEEKLQTIEIWEIKKTSNEPKSYKELDVWAFLNI